MRYVLPALAALLAAPAHAAGLPKLPTDAAVVAIVSDPASTVANVEGTAGRAGLAPPGAPAGWILGHPAVAWTAGQIDTKRPIYGAIISPKAKAKANGEAMSPPELVIYLPILPKANVERIVAQVSGPSRKLASRREGGYLLLSENRKRLAKRARRRALPEAALKWARGMDITVLFDADGLDDKTAAAMMGGAGVPEYAEDRVAKAAFESFLELSRASTPKGEMAMMGLRLSKDGLRLVTRTKVDRASVMGRWLTKMPAKASSLITGHAKGPLLGALATNWDAQSTVDLVKAWHRGLVKRVSKQDLKEFAPIAAAGPSFEKAFVGHPGLSFTVRSQPQGPPGVVIVGPRVPDEVRKQVPELKAVKADPKAKLPAHQRTELEPGVFAYLVDLGPKSVVAVNVARLDLPDIVAAAKAGAAPVADLARYRTARAALPKALVLEGYIDPGPLADLALQSPEAAQFRPLARLVSGLPPVALGVSVDGDVVQSEIFVAEGLIGLVGMGLSLASGPRGGPGSQPAR